MMPSEIPSTAPEGQHAEAGPDAPVPYTLTPQAEADLLDFEASNDEPEAGS